MNILIIENSTTLAHIIQKTLDSYDYKTTVDDSSFNTETLVNDNLFDLVILSCSLEKERSLEILECITRNSPDTKILGISKRDGWKKKVVFLDKGADDVLTYPFPMQELLARIQCITRRREKDKEESLELSDISMDTGIRSATKGRDEIPLRKQEYNLLEYLVRNKNRTVTRYELMDHVWDYRKYNHSNTIDVHVKRLRDKLGDRDLIQTVHGVGYKVVEKKKPKASLASQDE
jgi:DNA-binding response OmpR family regulator